MSGSQSIMPMPSDEITVPSASQNAEKKRNKIMGDKSPKSNQKKSSQKQAKTSSASSQKAQAVAAKQASGKKK
jgi:lipopolysaccharide export LptBFGC system permease protein LptF